MEAAALAKLVVEAVAASAVIVAVVLFLKDRRANRATDSADRQSERTDRDAERNAIIRLAENHINHSAAAMASVALANDKLADAIEHMADNCPCGHTKRNA